MKKKTDVDFLEVINLVHNYELNPVTREIYLHSHYSAGEDESGIEYRMSTQFIKNLNLLDQNNNKNILVHLQSPGGDWTHGMAMFDAVKATKSHVSILAYGEISSMSSIFFQSAPKRIMMPSCEFMIHRGSLSLDGVTTTVQSNAMWNKKTDDRMLKIYAERAINGAYFKTRNMNDSQVVAFIDKKIRKLGDWNLTAEEALHYGFCDGIFGSPGFEKLI